MNPNHELEDKALIDALSVRYMLDSDQQQSAEALLALIRPAFDVNELIGTEPATRYQPETEATGQ